MPVHIVVADRMDRAGDVAQQILESLQLAMRPQVCTPASIPRRHNADRNTHIWDVTSETGRRQLHPDVRDMFSLWLQYAETCGAGIHQEADIP